MRTRRPTKLALASVAITGLGLLAYAAASAAAQLDIEATNAFGPLTEVGHTTIIISLDQSVPVPGGAHFRCGATGVLVKARIVQIAAVMDPGNPGLFSPDCQFAASADVGPLDPGDYTVMASVVLPDRSSLTGVSTFSIVARGAKCNVNPLQSHLLVALANKTADTFQMALATDPAYSAALGPIAFVGPTSIFDPAPGAVIAFPPLDDPVRVMDRLQRSGEFNMIETTNTVICFPEPPPDFLGAAIEYYSPTLDHYFFTANSKEQQVLDAGMIAGNWIRTGKSFKVVIAPGCAISSEGGQHPIYRFTGEPNIGPDSHFFTVSQEECAVVRDRTEWHWMFEGAPFWASEPVAGTCPAGFGRGSQPLYRAYNNGKGGTANHRYSPDQSVIDAMVAQGWVDEGLAMCIAGP